jgi:hypothetical protein
LKLRFKVWKDWYKRCLNGRVCKIMVLLGLQHSPTFERNLTMTRCGNIFMQEFGEEGNE